MRPQNPLSDLLKRKTLIDKYFKKKFAIETKEQEGDEEQDSFREENEDEEEDL